METMTNDNKQSQGTADMTKEQIKFEMTRANKNYESCVKLGLADSADQFHTDCVELRNKLEATTTNKGCDWCGDDIKTNCVYVGRGRTYECCSKECRSEAMSNDH